MKKHMVEIGITLFIVLFMRLTILDNGFLVGFKNKVGLDIPIQVMQYESQQGGWLRQAESTYGLLQVASGYNFIIIGKYGENWFLFDNLKNTKAQISSSNMDKDFKTGLLVILLSLLSLITFAFSASKISKTLGKSTNILWFFIPFYNLYLLLKVTDMNKLLLIGLFIPYINILIYGYIWGRISTKLNKNPWLYGITTPIFINVPALILAYTSTSIETEKGMSNV